MLPFWSNYLIRTYAWMVLLNRTGLDQRRPAVDAGVIDRRRCRHPLQRREPIVTRARLQLRSLRHPRRLCVARSSGSTGKSLIEASADLGASGAADVPEASRCR
jgi:hypothetical protein